jgi:release factor glutamine methyltransferase
VTTTIKWACHQASRTLAAHAIDDATLEAELLLMHVLGIDRAHLYVRFEDELLPDDEQAFDRLIDRRLSREPISYITGHREFFGEDFFVAPGVLIPRAESELLVEEVLRLVEHNRPDNLQWPQVLEEGETRGEYPPARHRPVTLRKVESIADIGTGCGAIAISLALRLPGASVYATDISPRALEIAAINCHRHGVQVHLLEGDLLSPVPEPVDIIIANLPYVMDEELGELGAEIRVYEPRVALAGGREGLDKVHQLLAEAPQKLRPGGVVLLEIAPPQGPVLTSWVEDLFPDASVELIADLSGASRVLKVVLTGHRVRI